MKGRKMKLCELYFGDLEAFKNDEITLLVCSDVAARGLDVAGLSHVFNYDVPFNADDYVHRIGRTGRAGLDGRAWSLASKGDDGKFVDAIEKLIKKPIPVHKFGEEEVGDKPESTSKKVNTKPKGQKSKRDQDDASDQKGFGDDVPAFFG